MGAIFQQNLPAMPLERPERRSGDGESDLQKREGDLTFEEAKRVFGDAVWQAIRDTDHGLKDFGDAAQVGRYCKATEVPPIVVRLLQKAAVRREFVQALAEGCPGMQVQTLILSSVPRRRRS